MPSGYDWYDGPRGRGRKGAGVRRPRRSRRWRRILGRQVRVMKKLDQSKVEYIAAEKRKGSKNATIAGTVGISVGCVQRLRAGFKNAPKDRMVFPADTGRPLRGPPAREGQSAVLSARRLIGAGASRIWDRSRNRGASIPRGVLHKILREPGDAAEHKRKRGAASGSGTSGHASTPCGIRTTGGRTTGAG